MTDNLLPCPFCCKPLEDNPAFSTRSQKHFAHPVLDDDETPCILEHIAVVVSDRESDLERVAAWNRRDFSPMSIATAVIADAVTQPPTEISRGPADQIIAQIEALFPDWQSYRDLVDCIECTLHRLKTEGGR